MDPAIKAFLDKLETALDASIAAQRTTATKINELMACRPDLERRVADLGDAVAALQLAQPPPNKECEDGAAATTPTQPPATHDAASGITPGSAFVPHGATNHGGAHLPRGWSATPPPLPANGQLDLHTPSSPPSPFAHPSQLLAGLGQAHPSIVFPLFSGENPRLWKTLCEQHFQMFGIHSSFWVPMAALNFSGSASIWLQSVQKKLSEFDWDTFSSLLCTHFGRDRHQLLIRQFYTVRQTSSVTEYIVKFELIINHLSSYSDTIHPYYFLTRFVEGLRPDIRAVVLVQRPPDLDTACSLALLQEEVVDGVFRDASPSHAPRPPDVHKNSSIPLPLPPPPTRVAVSAGATDRRGTEGARADNSKIKALRDYRRAPGLCFKCGERWGHDHTCPTSVQLHVVEELLELFGLNTVFDNAASSSTDTPEIVMAISRPAVSGGVSAKAFQLQAWIQGHEVLMLVDSGSSTSFINQELAWKLTGVRPLPRQCRVRVADGGNYGALQKFLLARGVHKGVNLRQT